MKLFIASTLLAAGCSTTAHLTRSPNQNTKKRRLDGGGRSNKLQRNSGSNMRRPGQARQDQHTNTTKLDVGVLNKKEEIQKEFDIGERRKKKKSHELLSKKKQLLEKFGTELVTKRKPYHDEDGGSDYDVDIPFLNQPTIAELSTCSAGYVYCYNGFQLGSNKTCGEACLQNGEQLCCDGDDACKGFTGEVCKDGYSCVGDFSCENANIESVVNGCSGFGACYEASIGSVVDGCLEYDGDGDFACTYATIDSVADGCQGYNVCYKVSMNSVANGCVGKNACYESSIGSVQDGCIGYAACSFASIDSVTNGCTGPPYASGAYACFRARMSSVSDGCFGIQSCYWVADIGGTVGPVTKSCYGYRSCAEAADYGGEIISITDSCRSRQACELLANNDGKVGVVESSCTVYKSCYAAAAYRGEIGNITSSCISQNSCQYSAFSDGTIGDITSSCLDRYACYVAAVYYGKIDSISDSCLGPQSCDNAAFGATGSIGPIIRSCKEYLSCAAAAKCDFDLDYPISTACDSSITKIENSCYEVYSCFGLASYGGNIEGDGVLGSCKAESSCYKTASGPDGNIPDGIVYCCNEENQCEGFETQPQIEDQGCPGPKPPSTPTSSPIMDGSPTSAKPTLSPTKEGPSSKSTKSTKSLKPKSAKNRVSLTMEELTEIEAANEMISSRPKANKAHVSDIALDAESKIASRVKAGKPGGMTTSDAVVDSITVESAKQMISSRTKTDKQATAKIAFMISEEDEEYIEKDSSMSFDF